MGGSSGGGGVLAGGELIGGALGLFLVQAIIVIMLTRLLAVGLQYVHQPRVIAEVIGGILLGPSFLGGLLPGFTATVFPASSLAMLTMVANLGLVLYLFLVGIELDPRTMVANVNKTFLIASFGIATPFAFGWLLAPYLYRQVMQPDMPPGARTVAMSSFAVFICVAISITAFPVLARIMNETKLLRTPVGITALGAAALDDVTAWSLLALSFALIHASEPAVAAYIILAVTAYALFVLVAVRPIWWRIVETVDETGSHTLQSRLLALTFLLLFASAWATEALGVHAIFGGFLLGLIMPRGHPFTMAITEKLEDIVQIVFLPLYFAASGLKTDINSLQGGRSVGLLVLVLTVSVLAKLLGCGLGARLTGLTVRESVTVGVLMNTRGLVELIVLNMGLEAKVINVQLFTIMVLVALVTTFMTTPMVALIYPPRYRTPLAPLSSSPCNHMLLLPTTTTTTRDRAKATAEGGAMQQGGEGAMAGAGEGRGAAGAKGGHPWSWSSASPFRLVVVLERLDDMPALTNLLYLLKAADHNHHHHHQRLLTTPLASSTKKSKNDQEQEQQQEGAAGAEQPQAQASPSPFPARQHSSSLITNLGVSATTTTTTSSSTTAFSSSSSLLPPAPPASSPCPALSLTALHFSDASSACSDMLRATMPDVAKSTDLTLYMIKVFGELVGASVSTESVVGPPAHFAAHLASRARGADLTILPYKELHSRGGRDSSSSLGVLGDYHEKFVQSAIAKATSPLAILLNPRGGQFHGLSTDDTREILLIVTGAAQGRNDREAIQVGRRLQQGIGRGGGLHLDVLVLLEEEKEEEPDTTHSQEEEEEAEEPGEEEEEEEEAQQQQQPGGGGGVAASSPPPYYADDEEKAEEGIVLSRAPPPLPPPPPSSSKKKKRQQAESERRRKEQQEELEQLLGPREVVQLAPPSSSAAACGVPAAVTTTALSLLRQHALRRPYEFIIFGAGKLPAGWDQQQQQAVVTPSTNTHCSTPPPHNSHHHPDLSSSSSHHLPPRHHLQHHHQHQHLHLHHPHHHPHRALSPLTALASEYVSSDSPRLSRRTSLLGGSCTLTAALAEVKAPLLAIHAPAATTTDLPSHDSSGSTSLEHHDDYGGHRRRRYPSYAHALLGGHHHRTTGATPPPHRQQQEGVAAPPAVVG